MGTELFGGDDLGDFLKTKRHCEKRWNEKRQSGVSF